MKKAKFFLRKDFKKIYLDFLGMSVKDLALKVRYSESQVSEILNQRIEPSLQFMRKLCVMTSMRFEQLVETKYIES